MVHPAYKIEGPALVSFSGGRTSAYMLHEIVRAWDGKLPDDVHVCFANTGKEREETLRFVHECGSRWGVKVRWLEYRNEDGKHSFEEVGYNSASRKGEPFEAIIRQRGFLPNPMSRFCTVELKIHTMARWARSLGFESGWLNVIGLRYDEGHRVLKALDRMEAKKDPWRIAMPLSKAKVTKADVKAFWATQPFDLGLRDYEGNCDLCFLKTRGKIVALARERPDLVAWWLEQERYAAQSGVASVGSGDRFKEAWTYGELAREVRDQGHLFDGFMDEEHDAECGLICS